MEQRSHGSGSRYGIRCLYWGACQGGFWQPCWLARSVDGVDRALTRFQGSMLVLIAGTTFSFGPLTFRALLEADA